ncbi:MAG TPA: endonuclease/exonuclease/phosphatase family protein [Pyrinomonadaceae bacterium]|nr:endonuclease/exonuclease/phosphatase family protein [Pyrinomonadaceae bacterium]
MSRRTMLFVFILVLLGTLWSGVPAARLSTSASMKRSLRVMTYNIHVGVGMDKKLDLERIADVIGNEHPDLVGLQEVDRGVKRTELRDEILELAKLTGMDYAFAHNLDFQGGQYGVAILSRLPIQKIDHRKYENRREAERRGMIRVEAKVDNRVVNFVTTHLDYQYEDGRVFETEQMLEFLQGVKGLLIVVGDFNDEPSGAAYKLMLGRFQDAWITGKTKGEGLSYPADKPAKRIDYIFTRQSDHIRAKQAWLVTTLASDHLPVVADLEIR